MKTKLILFTLLAGGLLHAQLPDAEGYKKEIIIKPLLKTTVTSAGQPIVYPQTDSPEVTAVLVEIPPGAETGWHKHPFPCFAYVISGSLDVDIEGGKTHHFTDGQALAESINLLHNGRNTGTEPVRLVMFAMGEKAKAFTERASGQP